MIASPISEKNMSSGSLIFSMHLQEICGVDYRLQAIDAFDPKLAKSPSAQIMASKTTL